MVNGAPHMTDSIRVQAFLSASFVNLWDTLIFQLLLVLNFEVMLALFQNRDLRLPV